MTRRSPHMARVRFANALAIATTFVSTARPDTGLVPAQILLPVPPIADGSSGSSIAIRGEWMVVGGHAQNLGSPGSATLYRLVNGAWTWFADLTLPVAANLAMGDGFGWHVAMSDDLLLVSANLGGVGSTANAGAVFIFRRNGAVWNYTVRLDAPTSSSVLPEFGHWCDVFGTTIVVGAPRTSLTPGNQEGEAHVYEYNLANDTVAGPITLQAFPTCVPDCAQPGGFGGIVTVGPDIVAVAGADSILANATCCGGMQTGAQPILTVGAVYVFRRNGAQWVPEQRIVPDPADWTDFLNFGIDLTLRDDLLFVPLPNANGGAGRVDVYARDATTQSWSRVPNLTLTSPSPLPNDRIGTRFEASLGGVRVIAGATGGGLCQVSVGRAIAAHRNDLGTASYFDDKWDCVSAIESPLPNSGFGVDVAIDTAVNEATHYGVGARCLNDPSGVQNSGATVVYSSLANCPCACVASTAQFGSGCPGTNGIPSLTLQAPPVIGAANVLKVSSSAPALTIGFLLVGVTPTDLPRLGCWVYVIPVWQVILPVPVGGADIPFVVDPALMCGFKLRIQSVITDPGGPFGYTFSPRLDLTFGS